MIIVIGREYSIETRHVLRHLEGKALKYEFIDIDYDFEDTVDWKGWLKAHKILALPVVKIDEYFVVGDNLSTIDRMIRRHYKE